MQRLHHFYVATAKFVFQHPEYGIVSVRDPIQTGDASRYGLNPILLYGLTVAGLPIRWTRFSAYEHRLPFREVLFSAWQQAAGLRGAPDTVMVNRYLAQSDPTLVEDLAKIGVALEIAGPREKALPASLRSAQEESRWISGKSLSGAMPADHAIKAFSDDALADHIWKAGDRHRSHGDRALQERVEGWLALPDRAPNPSFITNFVWEPGAWLTSWETSLPPNQERYFSHSAIERRTWLHTGAAPREEIDADEEDVDILDGYDNAAEIAKNVVTCWPNTIKDIAQTIGVTSKELNWFLDEKSSLDPSRRNDLVDLLGVEFDEFLGCYSVKGPFVLIAKKARPLEDIYTDLTGGGDAWPCELVPSRGRADPSWRYVLINPHSRPPSILMVPRGDQIGERLDELLLNFDGARRVEPGFYRDVVSTCAKACQSPRANGSVMRDFSERHLDRWAGCMWLPGEN